MSDTETKQCPQCAETIQAAAIKCRYCGSSLGLAAGNPPTTFQPSVRTLNKRVIVAAAIGALALGAGALVLLPGKKAAKRGDGDSAPSGPSVNMADVGRIQLGITAQQVKSLLESVGPAATYSAGWVWVELSSDKYKRLGCVIPTGKDVVTSCVVFSRSKEFTLEEVDALASAISRTEGMAARKIVTDKVTSEFIWAIGGSGEMPAISVSPSFTQGQFDGACSIAFGSAYGGISHLDGLKANAALQHFLLSGKNGDPAAAAPASTPAAPPVTKLVGAVALAGMQTVYEKQLAAGKVKVCALDRTAEVEARRSGKKSAPDPNPKQICGKVMPGKYEIEVPPGSYEVFLGPLYCFHGTYNPKEFATDPTIVDVAAGQTVQADINACIE